MKRLLKNGGVALVALVVLAACGEPASDATDEPIRIGVIADLSGFMSGHGESTKMGSEIAVEYLNARGGVLGREVSVVVLDGQSDPAATADRARELIGRHDVKALLGTGTSAATLAAIGPATEAMVPFLYSLDGEIKTCLSGDPTSKNPFVFATGFTERMAVRPLMEYLVEALGKDPAETKVFFVGGDYVYPRTTNAFAIEVAESMGLTVLGDEYSDTATSDYSPLIRRILEAEPDILMVTNPGASGVTFMRQAQQFELPKKMLVSGFATFDQEAIDAMGAASEGVYAINRYSNHLADEYNEDFLQLFRAKYPEKTLLPGPTAAAGSFGAMLALARGIENSGDVDADGLIESLEGLSMDLPQGPVTINPTNHMFEQQLYILKIEAQQYLPIKTIEKVGHPGFDGCSVL